MSFLGDSVVKNLLTSAEDAGLISGMGRSSGIRNGNLLRHSCLENSMERSLAGYNPWGSQRVGHD